LTKSPKDKFHFYLVAGNVIIDPDGSGENVQAIPVNGMLRTDTRDLGVHQIAKAQQALQISLSQKMGEVVNAVDVIIVSIIHLGYMTEEVFQERPAGVKIERKSGEIIDFTAELQNRT